MSDWLVKRRLSRTVTQLAALRAELAEVVEQAQVVSDDADDSRVRALVSDSLLAAQEANDLGKHAAAIERHRSHLMTKIRELEATQDALLDRLSPS
ncbi:MAG: hypothetical protein CSA55_03555 [Ilumatobacter coccineus]|uniref:Uncharacterized protein n=1 Tax=Ilumatobacter coccineus TaxID=467094 RepID=A0A2G6K9T3_9ACTN|nr:MAG: hypothetical protein CSA55_03555 [Ilumatobacter coccineus]